jgi:large subunit ribosomal protein L15
MKLKKLPKTTKKSKKRVGRGYGSGKGGHTAGRGQKGQKSRSKVGLLFEGTKMRKSLIRRLPMHRGKRKFKSLKQKPIIINVKYLNLFKSGTEVTIASLVKNGLVAQEAEKVGVKILGDGKLEKKLKVFLPVSQGAKKKIEKAGGKVLKKVEKVEKVEKSRKEKIEKKVSKKAKTLRLTKQPKPKKPKEKVKVKKSSQTSKTKKTK